MEGEPIQKRKAWYSTTLIVGFVVLLAVIATGLFAYYALFGAPGGELDPERFTVTLSDTSEDITRKLVEKDFIRSAWAFEYALGRMAIEEIEPGSYTLTRDLTAWEMAQVLAGDPVMIWITVFEGLRKEEIGELFAKRLAWSAFDLDRFIRVHTNEEDYKEGVYFPDTYLIPLDATPADVAERMRSRFEEVFAPYAQEALEKNIKWTTVLKIAALIQREAAGKHDMGLISGVIWNRLDIGMGLQIDATIQYARGDIGEGWWAPIKPSDRKHAESLYNTYLHAGLTPTPIANPGLDAIEAALNPEETDCFFYLHDANADIYCSETYDQHKAAIKKYLQ